MGIGGKMASIYHPRYPTGKRSPYWTIVCYLGKKKQHTVRLVYPDGTRVRNTRDAWRMCREHEAVCLKSEASSRTVSDAMGAYLEETVHERAAKAQRTLQERLGRLVQHIDRLPLADLSSDAIRTTLNRLMSDRRLICGNPQPPMSKVTRDHYLEFIRQVCRWCVRVKGWLARDPSEGIQKIGTSPSRAFVPEERWDDLLARANGSPYAAGTAFALMTGLRASETVQELPTDIRLDKRIFYVRAEVAKTGAGVARPLMEELVPILEPLLALTPPDQPLFPYRYRPWQKSVKGWLLAMGYRGYGLGIHTLRHSFATWAYERYGEYKGQWLTRHKSQEMARRYTHLRQMPVTPDEMRRSVPTNGTAR